MTKIKENIKPKYIILSGAFIMLLGFIEDDSNIFPPWIKITIGIIIVVYGIIIKIKNKHE